MTHRSILSLLGAGVLGWLVAVGAPPPPFAAQAIRNGMYLPHARISNNIYSFGFSNIRLQAATISRATAIGFVTTSGTVDTVELGVSSVSAPSDVKFSFQNVGADGFPDGTVDQFRVLSSGSIADGWLAPGLMTSDGTDTGTKRTVTVGEVIAIVAEWDSTQSGEVWINSMTDNNNLFPGMPYGATHNGTSWTRTTIAYTSFTLKYADGTYEALSGLGAPLLSSDGTTFNSSSTPDEIGLIFSLPVSMAIGGAWVAAYPNADGGDFDTILYDSDGSSVLASYAHDSDFYGQLEPPQTHFLPVWWAPVSLSASTTYRLVVKPTTTTNILVRSATFNSAALTGVMGGGEWHLTERTDAGSWTETTTERPFMGLLVTSVDDGAGAGSGGGGSFPFIGGLPVPAPLLVEALRFFGPPGGRP
jgi:hypothetical protein